MTFDDIWAVPTGTMVAVSDGSREPRDRSSVAWRVWRSRNFTGRVADRGGDSPSRWIRFDIELGETIIGYTLSEQSGCTFDLIDEVPELLAAYKAEAIDRINARFLDRYQPIDVMTLFATALQTRLAAAGVAVPVPLAKPAVASEAQSRLSAMDDVNTVRLQKIAAIRQATAIAEIKSILSRG